MGIEKSLADRQAFSYPRAESNRNRQNRNLKFYPLNYGGRFVTAKILFFFYIFVIFAN